MIRSGFATTSSEAVVVVGRHGSARRAPGDGYHGADGEAR
jgi:hypothetical protein